MDKRLATIVTAMRFALTILPFSCTSPLSDTPAPADGSMPILFTASAPDAGVKGAYEMTTASLDTIGIYAVYGPEFAGEDNWRGVHMSNVPYTRNARGVFDTDPERFWPIAGNVTFYALAPYDRGMSDLVDISDLDLNPSMVWRPASEPGKQKDLCVAVRAGVTKRLEVPLEFHHATSQICFAANYYELEDNQFIIIDTIRLRGLIGVKSFEMTSSPPYVEWQEDEGLTGDASYTLFYGNGHPDSSLDSLILPLKADFPDGRLISNTKGSLFVVPQSFDGVKRCPELEISYTVWFYDEVYQIGPNKVKNMNIRTALPAFEWKPDNRYRYIVTIADKEEEIDLNVVDDYTSSHMNFFAMSCAFTEISVVNSVGFKDTLQVVVGPDAINATSKTVEWYTSAEDSSYVRIRPLPIDPAWEEKDRYNRMAEIECLKETPAGRPATVMVRTVYCNSEEERLFASCSYTVVPTGVSLDQYPLDSYDWSNEPE